MPIYGTDNAYGVPISLSFEYDGTLTNWGSTRAYNIAPLSNKAESIDGGYEISNMDVQFIDTDGSVWAALGNGTGAFNKTFSATVYVGGSMGYSSYGPQSEKRLALRGLGSAATYTVHTGVVVNVSKSKRLVRIKSYNNLKRIGDLEWRFPYYSFYIPSPTTIGSYIFYPSNIATSYPNSVIEANEQLDEFNMYAAAANPGVAAATSGALGDYYPSIAGKGTLGLLSGYTYPGTQFYTDYSIAKYKGTWLGTHYGSITTDEEAQRYGFSSRDAAVPFINLTGTGPSGTYYVINKTRLHIPSGTLTLSNNVLFPQQSLTLIECPANLFKELVAGHCVTPYFGTTDIESLSFATSLKNTAYQGFYQKIDPKGGKVADTIKNLVDSVYGMFSISTDNKFEFRAYGPRDLTGTSGTLGPTEIIDCTFENDIANAFNRVLVRYSYANDNQEFKKQYEVKGTPWSTDKDIPFIVESKWLQNDNEARVFAHRMLARFSNTVPNVKLTVPLSQSGVAIGSLFRVTDVDSGLAGKVVEVTSFEKDFSENRSITIGCIDGDTVYVRKGFGLWEDGTLMTEVVTGTSSMGWGTSGTMTNINATQYGSQFVWW